MYIMPRIWAWLLTYGRAIWLFSWLSMIQKRKDLPTVGNFGNLSTEFLSAVSDTPIFHSRNNPVLTVRYHAHKYTFVIAW